MIEAETGDENAVVNGAGKYHISYIGILRDRFKPDPLRIYFLKSAFTMIDTMPFKYYVSRDSVYCLISYDR